MRNVQEHGKAAFMPRTPRIILLSLIAFSVVFTYAQASWCATPAAPSGLTATTTLTSKITLTWKDNSNNESGFSIERAPNSSGTYTVIGTVGANVATYASTSLTQNSTYYYRVRAYSSGTSTTYSSYSNTASARTTTLTAPSSLVASSPTTTRLTLTWVYSSSSATRVDIESSATASTGPYSSVGSVKSSVTTTTLKGLSSGTLYYFRVRALDGTNYSLYSNVANTKTLSTGYTITATAGTNGSISPSGAVSVSSGGTQTFTITPSSGYQTSSLMVDGSSTSIVSSYTFTNVSSNHTISAAFSAITYTITASAGSNGTISPSGAVSVNSGSTKTFTMTSSTGYSLTSLAVDGSAVTAASPYVFSNVVSNHTISATFADTTPPTGTLSINNNAAYANSTTVTLSISATDSGSGVSQMQFSNDNTAWSTAETYSTSKLWTLSTGDGLKAVYAKYKDTAGNWSLVTGASITLDTTSPTITITSPVAGTTRDSAPLLSYTVTDATTTVASITVNVDGSLVTKVSGSYLDVLSNGTHTVRIDATDAAGNASYSEVGFTVNPSAALILTGVAAASNTINTALGQTASIFFTIDSHATVTLSVFPEKQGLTGTPIYKAAMNTTGAGPYVFSWNGADSTGKVVPDEAYLFTLVATSGSATAAYSPVASSGSGTVTCSWGTYNAIKNNPLTIQYLVTLPSRVNVNLSLASGVLWITKAVPLAPGTYTADWYGRDSSDKQAIYFMTANCYTSELLPENYIITTGDTPIVSSFRSDPYAINLSYGNTTDIQYTLSRDSLVTINIISPSGKTIPVIASQYQTAGTHDVSWNALDSTDATGKKLDISESGSFEVSILAGNPVTGTSSTLKGSLQVGY
jgi:hypothetical protein